ncbi:MAG TPA: RND transporter, partial [Rhizobacter sp.]|nr:RND transporter [Rhizobacter sp.]
MPQAHNPVSARCAEALPALTTLLVALASTLVLTLVGCASTAGIEPSAAKPVAPAALGLADGASTSPVATDWWQGFGDPALSGLVTRALDGNPNLKTAQARLAHSQAAADVVQSASGPQLNASFDATRQLFTENSIYPPPLAG